MFADSTRYESGDAGLNHEEWLEIVQNFGPCHRLAARAVDRLQVFGQQ